MRLLDDDEIQRVDQTYLGPPGRFIGRIRYRVLVFFILIFPLALALVDRTLGLTLWPFIWVLILSGWGAGKLADNLSLDRPVTTSIGQVAHELVTPREPTQGLTVRGPKIKHSPNLAPVASVERSPRVRDL